MHNFERIVEVKFNFKNYEGDIETIARQLSQFYRRITDPVINNREKFSMNDIYSVAIMSESFKDKSKPFFIRELSKFLTCINSYCI